MKRVLVILLVLFLLTAVGVGVFLAPVNADRYRPIVVQRVEAVLGRPVQLKKISLRWKGGIAAEFKGLAVSFPPRAVSMNGLLRLLPLLWGDIQIQEGTLVFSDPNLQPPLELTLEEIRLKAGLDLRAEQLDLKEASAKLGGGRLFAAGVVRHFTSRPEGGLHLKGEKILLPNVNLLRELFDRLTLIPGLTETLLSHLPPASAQKLTEKNTLLNSVNLDFTLESGVVSFPEFRAATDSLELTGSGRTGLDGSLDIPAQIFIQPDLSAALIKSAEELRFLTDDRWRIVLPVRVTGTVQKPSVSPDLQYVASKLLSNKAQDLVGELLNKVLEKKQ